MDGLFGDDFGKFKEMEERSSWGLELGILNHGTIIIIILIMELGTKPGGYKSSKR